MRANNQRYPSQQPAFTRRKPRVCVNCQINPARSVRARLCHACRDEYDRYAAFRDGRRVPEEVNAM